MRGALLSLFLVTCCGATFAAVGCGSSADSNAPLPVGSPAVDAGPDGTTQVTDVTDASSENSPAKIAGVSVASVCSASAQKICSFLTTCSPKLVDAYWADPNDCLKRFEENCTAGFPPNASLRKDDADAFDGCLGGLTCDALYGPRWTTACTLPRLTTTKPLDASCRINSECESNSCSGDSTACGNA